MTISNKISFIDESQKKKWANIFVDIYIEQGETAAGQWAVATIPKKYHVEMFDDVQEAFKERGWELIKDEEED